jgi:hypothetical protein
MTHLRPLILGTVAALLVGPLLATVPAQAADGDPVTCTISHTAPDSVTIGLDPQQVQFVAHTDCDGTYPVDWQLFSDQYVGSNASWLMMRNWDKPGAEKYTYVESPEGYFTIDPVHHGVHPGNAMAGEHPLFWQAFADINGNAYPDWETEPISFATTSFRLLRATTFGNSFAATPTRAHHQQLVEFTGSLRRADWDTAQYENLGAWVTLQFRRSGSERWKNITRVWDDGVANISAKAKRSGTWRYHYDGDGTSGASDSNPVFVSTT